jgi:tetratricopeptide (TPR) repeat protein
MKHVFTGVVVLGIAAGFAFEALRGNVILADDAKPAAAAKAEAVAPPGATLIPGLGNHPFAITTRSPEAQRWFNQGLMLTFGFNHDAAERSFLRAAQLDPSCAMCWWGASLVLGPHVNAGMDPASNGPAWERLQRARELAPGATPRERAFIEALAARYAANPPEDRRALDEAYAAAMGRLVAQRPDDLDAAVFHAEAMMDLQPWDYYDAAGRPKGHTAAVVAQLESVMRRNPDHAGALHLYVHAVEASPDPQRGVAAADHLRTLIPGSGHLVHMPAHIYARVGRWNDAIIANQNAIKADNDYIQLCGPSVRGVYPLGYVPHNHHFLWFAASMAGASEVARQAALETSRRTNLPDLMRQPGYAGLQNYWMTPWFDRVRFGRWEEIARLPNPAPDLPYVSAIWHYAQAMAAVRLDRMEQAQAHHAALAKLATTPEFDTMLIWDRYPVSQGVQIAERIVRAELALARHDPAAATAILREAVQLEDALLYDEPPAWHIPVRLALGEALLAAGRPAEAERVYRDELKRNPDNGWSLQGLTASLNAQHKESEAREVAQLQAKAWEHADIKLRASRL